MKNLVDVLEKLKVDDISLNEFPANGTLDDIIEFLKNSNFIIIEEANPLADSTVRKLINTEHKKICFIYKFMSHFILRFADTSKKEISTENPIFILVKDNNRYKNIYTYRIFTQYDDGHKDLDKEEWTKLINKRFGW